MLGRAADFGVERVGIDDVVPVGAAGDGTEHRGQVERLDPEGVQVGHDGGGTVGVVASVGPRRALQIYLAEDSFSAAQAHDWGLVVKVVPAVERKAATRELALRLAQNTPAAIAATKALIHRAGVTPIEQQLDAERDGIIDCMHSEEFLAAVKKFTAKGK